MIKNKKSQLSTRDIIIPKYKNELIPKTSQNQLKDLQHEVSKKNKLIKILSDDNLIYQKSAMYWKKQAEFWEKETEYYKKDIEFWKEYADQRVKIANFYKNNFNAEVLVKVELMLASNIATETKFCAN